MKVTRFIKYIIFILFLLFLSLYSSNSLSEEIPSSYSFIVRDKSLPNNTRHLQEGYWIGSMPDKPSQIDSLYNKGIKLIITVTHTDKSFAPISKRIRELNIEHLYIPIGSKFPKISDDQKYIISKYDSKSIYVHCDHGADRSGIFIAYLLINRDHFTIAKSLLSVVSKRDVSLLIELLVKNNIPITEDDRSYVSIYSGKGGLKLRGESYIRLLLTFLDSVK